MGNEALNWDGLMFTLRDSVGSTKTISERLRDSSCVGSTKTISERASVHTKEQ